MITNGTSDFSAVADVNIKNLNDVTALIRAEQHGHTKIIKILKDNGARK